jgi:adenine-specific DNA-methyltransferase
MNFKENESKTKLRGGYYTHPEIASFLLRWVLNIKPKSLLEPSCGDGVFFRCLKSLDRGSLQSILAFEIEPDEAKKARNSARLLTNRSLNVISSAGH